MLVVADTHVHIYPFYDLAEVFRHACANLSALAGGADHVNVLCLAERHDCRAFRALKDGAKEPPPGFRVARAGDEALVVEAPDGEQVYVIAGRQFVTGERLEILALTADLSISDGRPSMELVREISETGGVPVLSWAPGKWLFKRGRIVQKLIHDADAGSLVIGDTAARASAAEPRLMSLARANGLGIVAGSDPLPLHGEERYVGTYGSLMETEFDGSSPAESVRKALKSTMPSIKRAGRRCTSFEALRRFIRCSFHR